MKAKKPKKPLVAPPMRSMKRARKVTSAFHKLTRQLEEAQRAGDTKRARQAQAELDALGGRASYQEASVLTTSRHRTCKWVFSLLTQFGLRPGKSEPPLPVLEVGAVNGQLMSIPWLRVHAIDLRACHPGVKQCDFFDLTPAAEYQVVVSSMVLNCVPDALARGCMLRGMRQHLQPGGHLFVMVPLRCLTHSPYTTWDSFQRAVEAVGFKVRATKTSPKVAFLCAQAIDTPTSRTDSLRGFAHPPRVINKGPNKTNDFAVCFA